MSRERVVLVTNDDGYSAPGIAALVEVASKFGRVVVVAPKEPQSGKSHSITSYAPLYLDTISKRDNVEIYALNGTPVDCVKFATDHLLLGVEIDLILSGINHGSNAAINILYSGTMGAAIEGSFYNAPAIGFSHLGNTEDSDLTASKYYAEKIIERVISAAPQCPYCLNVNIPDLPLSEIKGVKTARQNRGYWVEEFFGRRDPRDREYFWLSGAFINHEPEANDTDIAALNSGYVAVVPVQVDMTNYAQMQSTAEMLDL
ncbi:MAG: 5'/3'-nucleotidase SurE [Rikenellaceae bacterium]